MNANTDNGIWMQIRARHSLAIVSGMALAAILLPPLASAQVEELIITAQKREEPLQDVPVAVTAYTEETLETLGIGDASEVVLYTPGLTSVQQNGSSRNFFLRGVGTFDFHLTAASAVGQYYDDVTLTSGFQARAALFDMERVEVLKGPQNTLFGLNTTGGAVNYISRQPKIGAGTEGAVEARLGSHGMFGVDAAVGFDNQDNLAVRLALHNESHDGPFESTLDSTDYGGDELTAYRGSLLWQPADRTSLTFKLHGSSNSNNGSPVKAVGTRQINNSAVNLSTANPNNPASLPINRYGLELCSGFADGPVDFGQMTSCLSRGNPNLDQAPVNPSSGDWGTVTQDLGFEDTATSGLAVKVAHELDFATLNFNLASDNLEVQTAIDGDGSANNLLSVQQEEDRDILQYELRLTSNDTESDFRWIGGLFILSYESVAYTGAVSPGFTGGRRPNIGRTLASVQLDSTKDNTGIYGQVEYDFNDSLTLTAGLRMSDEEIVGDYRPSTSVVTEEQLRQPIFADTVTRLLREQAAAAGPRETHDAAGYEIARQLSRTLTNRDTGYTLKLDWKPNESTLIYGSISTGFKGGALDTRPVYALVSVANVDTSLNESQLDPESLDAIEFGYKAAFMENKIRLDVAYFSYLYQNLQQFITDGGVPTLENAPESEISGIDGNLRYADGRGFYLDLGFSTLDANVTDASGSSFAAGSLGNAPPLSYSLLASKEFVLGNSLLAVTGGLSFVDEHTRGSPVVGNANVKGLLIEPAYTLVNAHIAYRFGPEHRYNATFAAHNLTDENFCGVRLVNDGGSLVNSMHSARAFHYNVLCRTNRAATSTFEVGFGIDF